MKFSRFARTSVLSVAYLLLAGVIVGQACGFFLDCWNRQSNQCAESANVAVASQCAGCQQVASACGCCDGCRCGDMCQCLAKGPCCDSCRCQLDNRPAVDPAQYPGVVHERMHQGGGRYAINGRKATRREVIDSLATVPDDRKELSLTFIGGTEAERAEAVALAKEMGLDKSTLIQSYDADNPIVKRGGFVAPAIYLQDPSGKVLMRAATMDRAALKSMSATVKVYDPSKDPTPDNFSLESLKKLVADVPLWAWLALAFLVLLYLDKKGKL